MRDYIVRATAAGAQIRAFAATTRNLVEAARVAHDTSPVMTAALGRLLTAGAMMGTMLKGEKDLLTLQIRGDGPGRGLTVTADSQGHVKGYPLVPDVILPANDRGKLDVAGAMGTGILSVIRDMGLGEPYVGQTPLQTGEIAEDLTYYFASSEQVPSGVGLGVLMERDNTVKQAGGFILQLMPDAEESVIAALEEKLSQVSSVTALLEAGNTPEQLLQLLLQGLEVQFTDTVEPSFYCNCDKGRVEKALISIGEEELREMVDEDREIEVSCQFCNRRFAFTVEELRGLLARAGKARLRD
ncbi:MAG: Hsp33 family molecular chaperone HslO [bacterium]|nr:Hsp33 family molecular chaperone HslO [bacterium]MCM1373870.1 Hsp33 family molecular chaperone HslO [Muribaculum sp.]